MVGLLLTAVSASGALHGQSSAPPALAASTEDTFRFRGGSGKAFAVVLNDVGGAIELVWPEITAASWDTALLGVRVSAGDAVTAPFIEIASGRASGRQYFWPGDAGLRWLNLSFLRGGMTAGARVTLRGEGANMVAGNATLRLFANNLDLTRSILVLAPHPDDAEIAAFGLYAFRRATVVTVTTGNAGPPTYRAEFSDEPELYHFKGRIRLIDSITVPWQGGIPPERAFNMGYFDARLATMYESPDAVIPEMYGPNTDIGTYLKYNIGTLLPTRPRASTWRNLVDDLERVLKKVKPAVIVAPHPQLDSHRDHQFTTVALAEALARWTRRVDLLLYTNHADRNRYPYGPASTVLSLPPPIPEDVLLDRVYSHPVPPDVQRLKLFALESMHDLRLSPSRLYQLVTGDVPGGEAAPSATDVSYFRRGPRSNELFFVYDRGSLSPMIKAFLTAWQARPERKTP
jgi:LmbE family N-acetylglucosaminyl deacetylase